MLVLSQCCDGIYISVQLVLRRYILVQSQCYEGIYVSVKLVLRWYLYYCLGQCCEGIYISVWVSAADVLILSVVIISSLCSAKSRLVLSRLSISAMGSLDLGSNSSTQGCSRFVCFVFSAVHFARFEIMFSLQFLNYCYLSSSDTQNYAEGSFRYYCNNS